MSIRLPCDSQLDTGVPERARCGWRANPAQCAGAGAIRLPVLRRPGWRRAVGADCRAAKGKTRPVARQASCPGRASPENSIAKILTGNQVFWPPPEAGTREPRRRTRLRRLRAERHDEGDRERVLVVGRVAVLGEVVHVGPVTAILEPRD